MKFQIWAGGACALAAMSMTLAGCGGGSNSGHSNSPAASVAVSATSGSKALTAPTVSPVTTDPDTGADTVSLMDPTTNTTLNNVAVSSNPAFQPTTGQPALVIDMSSLSLGANFAQPSVKAHTATPVSYATLYEGTTVDPTHEILQVGVTASGQILNSAAINGASDTYTINFQNIAPKTAPGTSLVINNLNFTFDVRTVNGQIQTSLPMSLKGVLPAFGESMTHDPTKPDYTGGGILFTTMVGTAGTASLFLDQVNGQFDKTETLGNAGADVNGQVQTQILTGSSGAVMGAPCREVQLTCTLQ